MSRLERLERPGWSSVLPLVLAKQNPMGWYLSVGGHSDAQVNTEKNWLTGMEITLAKIISDIGENELESLTSGSPLPFIRDGPVKDED